MARFREPPKGCACYTCDRVRDPHDGPEEYDISADLVPADVADAVCWLLCNGLPDGLAELIAERRARG